MNCLSLSNYSSLTSPDGYLGPARTGSVAAQELKHLDAPVELITDINSVVLVYVQPIGRLKLPGCNPRRADEHPDLAGRGKNLKVVERSVRYPDVSFAVERDPLGTDKISRVHRLLSELADKLEIGVEHLHRATAGVGHGKRSIFLIHRNAYRVLKLVFFGAEAADLGDQLHRLRVVHKNGMCPGVGDEQPLALFIQRHVGRCPHVIV